MTASTCRLDSGPNRKAVETASPGSRNDRICRRPSGKAIDDTDQPLQITGTNSDHSFGWKIVRRAGTVCTVEIGNAAVACRSSADAQPFKAAQRLNSQAGQAAQVDTPAVPRG